MPLQQQLHVLKNTTRICFCFNRFMYHAHPYEHLFLFITSNSGNLHGSVVPCAITLSNPAGATFRWDWLVTTWCSLPRATSFKNMMPFVPTVPTKTQEQFLFGYLTIKKPVKCDRNANIKTKITVLKHILGVFS